jgi:hypothetical protein
VTQANDPAAAYNSAVADIIGARASQRDLPPGTPQLRITNRREPRSVDELGPAEVEQLTAAWTGESLADVLVSDEEYAVEVADVVDEAGTLRFRLYGWNFGVGYLFPPQGLAVVAFAAQHDLEHWSVGQRALFAGMDRALRAGGHGFSQPLHFCWDDDSCWDTIAAAPPRSVGSEPHLRRQFGLDA